MSLGPWQRYRKASPCPICQGYGAYKPENRCKGFLKADGTGAYCSNEVTIWTMETEVGLLFFHPLNASPQKARERGSKKQRFLAAGDPRHCAAADKLVSEGFKRPPHPREFG